SRPGLYYNGHYLLLDEGRPAVGSIDRLPAAIFAAFVTLFMACNMSDPVKEVRDKFSARRADLERLRSMAEEDHLVELHLTEKYRMNPADIRPNRVEDYRSTLKKLNGLWIARVNEDLIWIPTTQRGWPAPFAVCGYLFAPKGAAGIGTMDHVYLNPLE